MSNKPSYVSAPCANNAAPASLNARPTMRPAFGAPRPAATSAPAPAPQPQQQQQTPAPQPAAAAPQRTPDLKDQLQTEQFMRDVDANTRRATFHLNVPVKISSYTAGPGAKLGEIKLTPEMADFLSEDDSPVTMRSLTVTVDNRGNRVPLQLHIEGVPNVKLAGWSHAGRSNMVVRADSETTTDLSPGEFGLEQAFVAACAANLTEETLREGTQKLANNLTAIFVNDGDLDNQNVVLQTVATATNGLGGAQQGRLPDDEGNIRDVFIVKTDDFEEHVKNILDKYGSSASIVHPKNITVSLAVDSPDGEVINPSFYRNMSEAEAEKHVRTDYEVPVVLDMAVVSMPSEK